MTTAPSRVVSCHCVLVLFSIGLSLIVPSGAEAQTVTPPVPPPATTTQQPTPPKPPTCGDKPPEILPAGNLKLSMALDRTTLWQPRGGEVKFTIKGTGFSPENMAIIACFRWKAVATAAWQQSPSLRLIENGTTAGAVAFAATVPPDLPSAPSGWLDRVTGGAKDGVSTGLFLVPIADFRVMAKSMAAPAAAWSPLDVTLPVGITSVPFSFGIAIALVVIAWFTLHRFGAMRGVPGQGVILKIITTKAGYASLSQLQIVLWSFVIGAGAVYVMALSGNLIDITQGTLVLLGISGAATIGSKLQSHTETQPTARAAPAPPGAVAWVDFNGPADESEVRLTWAGPTGGGPADTYTVQYRKTTAVPGPWTTATSTLSRPGFRVVGLTPATRYDFQVFAVNAGGYGATTMITTTTAASAAAVGIGEVARFGPTHDVTNSKIGLSWDAAVGATSYIVQFRVHDSDDGWTTTKTPVTGQMVIFEGLRANTLYDLRIAGLTDPNRGPWTTIAVATTGPRIPQWSDLIIASGEIDVTRVQMLFFTVIVALFVALKVLTSGEIPTIPEGFLLLMGISNGVYLTAKFIPS